LSKVQDGVYKCNCINPLTIRPSSFLGSQKPHWSNK
jgi:hypothetical protein